MACPSSCSASATICVGWTGRPSGRCVARVTRTLMIGPRLCQVRSDRPVRLLSRRSTHVTTISAPVESGLCSSHTGRPTPFQRPIAHATFAMKVSRKPRTVSSRRIATRSGRLARSSAQRCSTESFSASIAGRYVEPPSRLMRWSALVRAAESSRSVEIPDKSVPDGASAPARVATVPPLLGAVAGAGDAGRTLWTALRTTSVTTAATSSTASAGIRALREPEAPMGRQSATRGAPGAIAAFAIRPARAQYARLRSRRIGCARHAALTGISV